jgi:hypothetical protein
MNPRLLTRLRERLSWLKPEKRYRQLVDVLPDDPYVRIDPHLIEFGEGIVGFGDFDAYGPAASVVIGVLFVCAKMGGVTPSDRRALEILEKVRASIEASRK